jgi:hypothetical protein
MQFKCFYVQQLLPVVQIDEYVQLLDMMIFNGDNCFSLLLLDCAWCLELS